MRIMDISTMGNLVGEGFPEEIVHELDCGMSRI